MLIILYLAAITAANLLVAAFGPQVAVFNAFVLIALDLSTRDRLHEAWRGRGLIRRMALLIASGSALSFALALLIPGAAPPDLVARIALASLVAFGCAGATDAAVYAALGRWPYLIRANASNIAGGLVDSVLFLWIAFGWPALWPAALGLWLAKVAGGLIWSFILAPGKNAPAFMSQTESELLR